MVSQHRFTSGVQTATTAIRGAQERFAVASAQVARHGAELSSTARPAAPAENQQAALLSPPNPGPPGGARPADLAQAIVDQTTAGHELSANVKTLKAFDEMLDELTRLGT
jgi:hypothetical protein